MTDRTDGVTEFKGERKERKWADADDDKAYDDHMARGTTADTTPSRPVAREAKRDRKTDFDTEDKAYMEAGGTAEVKSTRKALLDLVYELNGDCAVTTPGTAMTYIKVTEFYQRVELTNGTNSLTQIMECAYNWDAMGRTKGALYGAAVRWAYRDNFVEGREYKKVKLDYAALTPDVEAIREAFVSAVSARKKQFSFWMANARNVGAMAGALMISAGHHFDSQNLRPQAALVGALGQTDDIDQDQFRSLFYLAVHPLPLAVVEKERKTAAEGKVAGFSEAVRVRANGVPSGYGAVAIAVAAFDAMSSEKYYRRVVRKFDRSLSALKDCLATIKANPVVYHVNATDYGYEKMTYNTSTFREVMVIGIAYARHVVKGTMIKAASAKKFAEQNKKAIEMWGQAFEKEAEADVSTLEELLGA
jgi:hypothetical protein